MPICDRERTKIYFYYNGCGTCAILNPTESDCRYCLRKNSSCSYTISLANNWDYEIVPAHYHYAFAAINKN